jgi:NAD(P)-dependent dehydrogenase (short-subunit alcohol dehydrogenase family)
MEPTVLITGASSGIGAATAQYLSERGFRVFGTSRRPAASPVSETNPIHWIQMDVCEDESVRDGVEQVLAAVGQLDALVCNAGTGIFGSVEEVPISEAKQQFETNFFGVLRLLGAVLPGMREARRGRIAVVGSLAGRASNPFRAHYSASKAAVESVVFAAANELHPYGVGISLIEPGDINTPFEDNSDWPDISTSAYAERAERAGRVMRDALPRAPGPEIVAAAIHRALTARKPRLRYPVGPDSTLVPLGRRLFPDRLILKLIRNHFKV